MNHHIIKKIVAEVFTKVKPISNSQTQHALSKEIEVSSHPKHRISYKTAARAHQKYIEHKKGIGKPTDDTLDNFCVFLDYDNYKDYLKKNGLDTLQPITPDPPAQEDENDVDPLTYKSTTSIRHLNQNAIYNHKKWIWLTATLLLLILMTVYHKHLNIKKSIPIAACMAWTVDHYEEIDCNLSSHPTLRTIVEPLDVNRMKTMRKIEVTPSYSFFSEETGMPLIWYYKTKKGEIEYYSSPGLHPLNGETLKKITPFIVKKYVPIHDFKPASFFL